MEYVEYGWNTAEYRPLGGHLEYVENVFRQTVGTPPISTTLADTDTATIHTLHTDTAAGVGDGCAKIDSTGRL